MSWLVDLKRFAPPRPGRIGPGRLVLVVGPSGAGKDTLISGARLACANDPSVVFPQRIVTRPPSPSEDNAHLTDAAFMDAVAAGRFALWWEAHGHRYGIPAEIDDHIRANRTVLCNVSRAITHQARLRYAFTAVVLVTAPEQVLKARLAARERTTDGSLTARMNRSPMSEGDADFVVRNVGRPEAGVRRLLNIIRGNEYFVVS